jgi:WD40 repeat protein
MKAELILRTALRGCWWLVGMAFVLPIISSPAACQANPSVSVAGPKTENASVSPGSLIPKGDPKASPSHRIQGPVLGYLFNPGPRDLRPILGLPGASFVGSPMDLGTELSFAEVSSRLAYALAVSAESGSVQLVDLARGGTLVRPIPGVSPGVDRIVISPADRSALLYHRAERRIQILSGLPRTPFVKRDVDASELSSVVTALAVSDDGGALLLAVADGESISLFSSRPSGGIGFIFSIQDTPAISMTFLPDSQDALVADYGNNELLLIRDVVGTSQTLLLADGTDGVSRPTAVATSPDGDRAFIANSASGTILSVGLRGENPSVTSCDCRPTGLYSLNGTSVFRVATSTAGPVILLDGVPLQPRTTVVPGSQGMGQRSLGDLRVSPSRSRGQR